MPSKLRSSFKGDLRKALQAKRRTALKTVVDLDKFLVRNGNVKKYEGRKVRIKTVKQMNRHKR